MKISLISLISLCVLFIIITSSTWSYAKPIRGASYIGICNPSFPCQKALRGVKALGYLADAFGHRCQCIREFLKTPGPKYLRVHLANGTCFPERGRKCGRKDVFYRESLKSAESKILRRDRGIFRAYEASILRTKRLLSSADAETTLRYSLVLEAPFSNRARQKLLKIAKRHFPEEALVDSVLSQRCLKGLICERHGDSMRYSPDQRCISDTDGIPFSDANLPRLEQHSAQCEAIFYWTTGFNLLPYGYSGKFIYPYERKHQPYDWELNELKVCLGS
jgi:hypothetical protein